MDAPGDARRRQNHIRSISRLFLSQQAVSPAASTLLLRTVVVTGRAASPWPLVLAVNLALAAWRREERSTLLLPVARIPAAARLLGAPPRGLGLSWCDAGDENPRFVEPLPGLRLLPIEAQALLPEEGEGWRLLVSAGAGQRGPRLGLLEAPGDSLPPGNLHGDPLFLLGIGFQPAPRQGITGIWGPLARRQLLDPLREGEPAALACDGRLLHRYTGFLEALRRFHPGRDVAQ